MLDWRFQRHCLNEPIVPSMVFGGVFTVLHVAQGMPAIPQVLARSMVRNSGFIYIYSALQCPMVDIHGKQSAYHNGLSGGILGFLAVRQGIMGVPFVDNSFFWRYPRISPPMMGAVMYGGIGTALGLLGGKPL